MSELFIHTVAVRTIRVRAAAAAVPAVAGVALVAGRAPAAAMAPEADQP